MSRKSKKSPGDEYLGNCPDCNVILSSRDLLSKGKVMCPSCGATTAPSKLEKPKPLSVFEDWDGIHKERTQG